MTVIKPLIFLSLLLSVSFNNLTAQNQYGMSKKIELGIDFASFNKNWIYYNNLLHPVNTGDYNFDLIPSLFARFHFEAFSLRLKYEHFKTNYQFRTNTADSFEEVDGTFFNNRYLVGIQKFLIDRRIKFYGIFDFGLSQTNFKGSYSSSPGGIGVVYSEPFNINGIGIIIQPGFGIRIGLFRNLFINLESSVYFEKGFDKNDPHFINPQNKIIPRPISLLGFSTCF